MTALDRVHGLVGSTMPYLTKTQLSSLAVLMPGKDVLGETKLVEGKLAKMLIAENVLHLLVGRGLLESCPPWLLTREALVKHSYKGNTPLHVLAGRGEVGLLPAGLVTAEMMDVRDSYNATPLHEAAANGYLCAIPPHLITPHLLGLTVPVNNPYASVGEENTVSMAINHGELPVLTPFLTEDLLLCRPATRFPVFRTNPTSPILFAARAGKLDKIPPALLTPRVLNHQSESCHLQNVTQCDLPARCTALDVAAKFGGLDKIPNLENYIFEKNGFGQSVLAQAVANGQTQAIRQFITPELLNSRHSASGYTSVKGSESAREVWKEVPLLEIAARSGVLTELTDVTDTMLLTGTTDHLTILAQTIRTGEFFKLPATALTLPVLSCNLLGVLGTETKGACMVASVLAAVPPRGVPIPSELEHLFSADWLEKNKGICNSLQQLSGSTEPEGLELF